MPLIRIDHLDSHTLLGLWQMTETPDELPVPQGVDLSSLGSRARLLERLTTYSLLHAMTDRNDLVINHLPSGQPLVDGYRISISHTRGWAALILSTRHEVAVDIEYQSDRINRIASRFIRPDEWVSDRLSRLIVWCAKEVAYKYFSADDLQYFDMRLRPFRVDESAASSSDSSFQGQIEVEDLKCGRLLPAQFEVTPDYVLVWSIPPSAEV
jgi:4'-phosphopantetheinyl transferase EntD